MWKALLSLYDWKYPRRNGVQAAVYEYQASLENKTELPDISVTEGACHQA